MYSKNLSFSIFPTAILNFFNKAQEVPDYTSYLPEELIVYIFQFLNPKDAVMCNLVNRRWRRCSNDQALWRFYFSVWQLAPFQGSVGDAKAIYFGFCPEGLKFRKNEVKKLKHEKIKSDLIKNNFPDVEVMNTIVWHGNDFGYTDKIGKETKIWDLATDSCVMRIPFSDAYFDFDDIALVEMSVSGGTTTFKHFLRDLNSPGVSGKLTETNRAESKWFSLAGDQIFLASNRRVRQLDRETMQVRGQYPIAQPDFFVKSGDIAVVGNTNGVIRFFDDRSGQAVLRFTSPASSFIYQFTLDDNLLLCSHSETIRIWDIRQCETTPLAERYVSSTGGYCYVAQKGIMAYATQISSYSHLKEEEVFKAQIELQEALSGKTVNTFPEKNAAPVEQMLWNNLSLYVLHSDATFSKWSFGFNS